MIIGKGRSMVVHETKGWEVRLSAHATTTHHRRDGDRYEYVICCFHLLPYKFNRLISLLPKKIKINIYIKVMGIKKACKKPGKQNSFFEKPLMLNADLSTRMIVSLCWTNNLIRLDLAPFTFVRLPRLHRANPSAFLDKMYKELEQRYV